MKVRTRWTVPRSPELMWPALCDSRVELTPRCPVFYLGARTRITRTTTVSVRNRFAAVLYPVLWVGLKSVHRFVFRNWQRQAA